MKRIIIVFVATMVLAPSIANAQSKKNKKGKDNDKELAAPADPMAAITKVPVTGNCNEGWTSVGLSNSSTRTINVTVQRLTTRSSVNSINNITMVMAPNSKDLLGCEGQGSTGSGVYQVEYRIASAQYVN